MNMAGGKVKEETGLITVKLQLNDASRGQITESFQTERNLPLRRILLDFCDRYDLVYHAMRFFYDGDRIRETQTADELKLADGDILDVFSEVDGGHHPAGP